jgi:uncharacterized protein YbjT (DUF2867 family)
MKVLMVGATGKYASHVIPELKQRGVKVRALVRHPDKLDAARHQGSDEAVVGDLGDAESLRAAAIGVEGVFHLNPAFASNEAELGVTMVEAAKAAGVRKFVFSSVIHPSISALSNHASNAQSRRLCASQECSLLSCSRQCLCKTSMAAGRR